MTDARIKWINIFKVLNRNASQPGTLYLIKPLFIKNLGNNQDDSQPKKKKKNQNK